MNLLTANKQRAIAALLTSRTRSEAAGKAGISARTLRDYFTDQEFQREYGRAFHELVSDATRTAQRSLEPAVSVLREIMEDPQEPGTTRVTAAKAILAYGLQLTETVDILQQLNDLEKWRDDVDSQH